MNSLKAKKVAILGGGPGAMSAAFWLSATPELREKFDVTVYTQGWRLGGKCASGRNAEQHERIQEHGLHILMGFYETVFYTIRSCYESMPMPDNPAFANWQAAFTAQQSVTLWCGPRGIRRHWRPWTVHLPQHPGLPGDGPMTLQHDPRHMNTAVERCLKSMVHGPLFSLSTHSANSAHWIAVLKKPVEDMCAELLKPAEKKLDLFVAAIREDVIKILSKWQHWFQQELAPWLRGGAELVPGELGFDSYRILVFLDLGFAGLIGFLQDVMPYGMAGFNRINELDFKQWLIKHGASQESTTSPAVMCLYDLGFAYEGGDSSSPENGKLAAGAVVYTALHMVFLYKDAPLYRMNAGMGDIILTPLYSLLLKYGVKFEFFSRVTELGLGPDKSSVQTVTLQRQAQITGSGDYQPLKRLRFADGKQWDCWPSEPDWAQLVDGDALKAQHADFENPWQHHQVGKPRTLNCGTDFDQLVLAIPPAAAKFISTQLAAAQPDSWGRMLASCNSVATQSVQVWFKPTLPTLGWQTGPTIASSYVEPFDSWATMDQVLAAECWPAAQAPETCVYYCGCLVPSQPLPAAATAATAPDPITHETSLVAKSHVAWLNKNYAPMFPNAGKPHDLLWGRRHEFDWNSVQETYNRANIAWSELYVQSFPDTIQYRLHPGKSGFSNLYLAGDWTWTTFNGGCVEAAFQSGLRAASAITGSYPPIPEFQSANAAAEEEPPSNE